MGQGCMALSVTNLSKLFSCNRPKNEQRIWTLRHPATVCSIVLRRVLVGPLYISEETVLPELTIQFESCLFAALGMETLACRCPPTSKLLKLVKPWCCVPAVPERHHLRRVCRAWAFLGLWACTLNVACAKRWQSRGVVYHVPCLAYMSPGLNLQYIP